MINRSNRTTLLMAVACISAPLCASTIQERENAVITQYGALITKWSPALDNPSDATMKMVIDKKKKALKVQMDNAFGDGEKQKEIKAVMDDLKTWPMTFMCNELDADIKNLFELIDTAAILNMEIDIDPTPFQELRTALDTLPSMKREHQDRAALSKTYTHYVLPGLGLVAAWYLLAR